MIILVIRSKVKVSVTQKFGISTSNNIGDMADMKGLLTDRIKQYNKSPEAVKDQ